MGVAKGHMQADRRFVWLGYATVSPVHPFCGERIKEGTVQQSSRPSTCRARCQIDTSFNGGIVGSPILEWMRRCPPDRPALPYGNEALQSSRGPELGKPLASLIERPRRHIECDMRV